MLRAVLRKSTSVSIHSKRTITNASHGILRKNKKKTLFFTGVTSLLAYDYTVRDLEYLGGLTRFLRSIKIAALVSADYSYSLWGIEEDSKEYDKVRINL